MDNAAGTRGPGGSPEGAAWFRAELAAIGQTQSGLAKWMKKRGGDRLAATTPPHAQRMTNGEARVSSEMPVILAMLRTGAERQAKKRTVTLDAA